jgi:putative transposase
MRYSASEKFEIIELAEQSSLSIRRTLAPIGTPRSTFYDWYSRYQEGGIEALVDGKPRPRRIWNKNRACVHFQGLVMATHPLGQL